MCEVVWTSFACKFIHERSISGALVRGLKLVASVVFQGFMVGVVVNFHSKLVAVPFEHQFTLLSWVPLSAAVAANSLFRKL